jgi:hypothetical protein
VESWLRHDVGCVIGRLGFAKDRFMLATVTSYADFARFRAEFGEALAEGTVISCLILIEPDNPELTRMSIGDLVRHLDRTYFFDADARLSDGGRAVTYNLTYRMRCPVTGERTMFNDFDQVAFYPQAIDESDPLYDPSMYAPVVCVNITSDVYGFSVFTDDQRRRKNPDLPFAEMSRAERLDVYEAALTGFQRMAARTIANYAKTTNPQVLPPIEVTADGCHYIAQHDESAFVETAKSPFKAEMPALYVPRVLAQWEAYFERKVVPDMSVIYSTSVSIPGTAKD